MLYDRDYMRDEDRSRWRSPVVGLLAVLVAVFLVECFLRVYAGGSSLGTYLGLSAQAVGRHEYWRIFTYEFLHNAPLPFHIIFNGLALWFFGRSVLETLGTVRFWQIYLGAGFVGALFELFFQTFHPAYRVSWTVGASACVMGLVGVFCLLNAGQEMNIAFYFFPVRLQSMTLFWILLGVSIFGVVFPAGNVAHGAHLGGLLAGAGFVKLFLEEEGQAWLRRLVARRSALPRDVPVEAGRQAGKPSGKFSSAPVAGAPETDNPEEFIRREVDPILDKISAHGIQSLTERERRTLEKARERMKGR